MPFIPDSGFGIAYMLACFGVAGLAYTRNNLHARIVSLIFIAHWFSLRAINVINHDNAALWVVHDAATILALGFYGKRTRSRLAFACGTVFFVVMLFDQWWLLFDGGFDANAAVAEAAGYLCFLMIAGAALGKSGMGNSGWFGSRGGHLRWEPIDKMGRSISVRRSAAHQHGLAANQDTRKEDCGA